MKPVLIVEGQSDVNRLLNYIDCDFVITNGSALNQETINYIKELKKDRRVIIFTDPDYPGEKIRSTLLKEIPDLENCYIRREFASNGKKLGVCECEEHELKRALQEVLNFKIEEGQNIITKIDLLHLKLLGSNDASSRRDYIATKIPLGKVNAKSFLKRINMLNISFKNLEKWMEEYDSK